MWNMIASGLMGGAGSFLGASSSNKAINRQSDAWNNENYAARDRQGMLMFGPEDWADFKLAMSSDTYTSRRKVSGGIGRLFGGRRKTVISRKAEVDAAKARFFGKYPSMQDEMKNITVKHNLAVDADLRQQSDNTGRLDRMASESEGRANDGQEAQMAMAQHNSDRGLQAANQMAMANLGMMGSNTLLSNQTSANANLAASNLTQQQVGIRQQGLQNWQFARNQRMGMLGGRLAGQESSASQANAQRYNMAAALPNARQSMMSGGAFAAFSSMPRGGANAIGAGLMSGANSVGSMGMSTGTPPPATGGEGAGDGGWIGGR